MKTNPAKEYGEILSPSEVRFVRLLPGPLERVWAYLTEPEKRATWFAGGPIELRVGGRVELHFRHSLLAPHETPPAEYAAYHEPGGSMIARVTQLDPPRLLSYTWGSDNGNEESEVSFELTPKDDQVQLVLTHRRLRRPEDMANVSGGWHLHLAYLRARLSSAEPPPFWPTHARLEGEYREHVGLPLPAK